MTKNLEVAARHETGKVTSTNWEASANAGEFERAVCEYIEFYDHVTFPELQRKFEPFVETRGTWEVRHSEYPEIYLWDGISERLWKILESLQSAGKIVMQGCSQLVYLIDGGALRLPLAKKLHHYKSPRWLPVVFRPAGRVSTRESFRAAKIA